MPYNIKQRTVATLRRFLAYLETIFTQVHVRSPRHGVLCTELYLGTHSTAAFLLFTTIIIMVEAYSCNGRWCTASHTPFGYIARCAILPKLIADPQNMCKTVILTNHSTSPAPQCSYMLTILVSFGPISEGLLRIKALLLKQQLLVRMSETM